MYPAAAESTTGINPIVPTLIFGFFCFMMVLQLVWVKFMVPETKGDRMKQLVKSHVESLGYTLTDRVPDQQMRASKDRWVMVSERGVTDAFRTSLDDPFGRHLVGLLQNTFEEDPVQIRIMGGTVPIAPFVNALEIPAFIVPLVNADNNQHSPNENLRLGNFIDGIAILMSVLSQTPE